MFPLEDNNESIELKLRLSSDYYGSLMPLDLQAKEGDTVLTGVLDPDYQWEIGLELHNGGKE